MKYDFDQEIDRKGSKCEKYDNLVTVFSCNDITPLWVADTDFATPPFIMDAIRARAEHPVLGYSFRDEGYFKSIASWLKNRGGWSVDLASLEFSPGVVCGISYGVNSLTEVGDKVVIQPPVYPPFARTVAANGRVVVNNPLKLVNGRYEIDFEGLDCALSDAKMFILCNPHNPTGRVFTRDELRHIGELCLKYGVKIVSDEIHCDLVMPGQKHIHMASISKEIADITLTYLAPSKTFNTAGLSTSVAIITNPEMMKMYRSNSDKLHVGQGNIFGAVALQAAYENGGEWVDELMVYLEGNADYVVDFIAKNMPKIKCYKPEATFLLWLDCRKMAMSVKELNEFMITKARLGLNDGSAFGKDGEGFMRLNIGTTRKTLEKAMNQLKTAYDNL